MGTRPGTVTWLCAVAMLATGPRPACAQVGGSTATLRGHVADSTGGVTPGASVTLLDVGTKARRAAVTDQQGGFTFTGLFPSTFELTVELAGFKTFHQTAIVLGPNDARGIDVQLEVGQRTETVVVTTSADIMQTETGAREGRLSAKQIDNLSIIGRSSLELLRILPGVVAPDQNQLESVSFIGGANNTQAYNVNGDSLDEQHRQPRRIDADRLRIELRPDDRREQRHGAGSEGPELELQRGVRHRAA